MVSKTKIAKLIETGVGGDWDDHRMFTLAASRRRGFPADTINSARRGVTWVDPDMLEAVVKDTLNTTAKRSLVVTQSLQITAVGDRSSRLSSSA